jgi:hypothetical protein
MQEQPALQQQQQQQVGLAVHCCRQALTR